MLNDLYLESLNFENNNIIEFTNKTFGNTKRINKLSLKNNKINKIQDYSFYALRCPEIDLENNNFYLYLIELKNMSSDAQTKMLSL